MSIAEFFVKPDNLKIDPTQYNRSIYEDGKLVSMIVKGESSPIYISKSLHQSDPFTKSSDLPKVVKESKASQARKIYTSTEDKSSANIIGLFVDQLKISRASAHVYLSNCRKKFGVH